MRQALVAAVIVSAVLSLRADTVLIPLVDPSDPVLITNSKVQFEDDLRPFMTLELENTTAFPIDTRDIWLSTSRFFTKSEVPQAGRKIWDCGEVSSAAHDEPPKTIPPKARIVVRHSLTTSCQHNRDHEHFWVEVSRIANRFSEPSWKRESSDFNRLLSQAMPHP